MTEIIPTFRVCFGKRVGISNHKLTSLQLYHLTHTHNVFYQSHHQFIHQIKDNYYYYY